MSQHPPRQPPSSNDHASPAVANLRFPSPAPSAPANAPQPAPARPALRLAGDESSRLEDDVIARFDEVTQRLKRLSDDLGCAGRIDGDDDHPRPRAA